MKRVVLVVDDNPVNLKLTRVTLEASGLEVVTACDAESARVAIAEHAPRVVLMDIQLPGTDGLTLTRELKAHPATRGLAIVAVTAYAMQADRERAFEAGCDGFVAKPVSTRELAEIVKRHLDGEPT